MAATLTEWWDGIAPKLRRALGLAPPTIEEADAEMAEAEAVSMTDEEIERIVDFATKEEPYDGRDIDA